MTKSMVLEYIFGLMEKDMRVHGLMESSMVKGNTFYLMEQ